jgi:GNAT superfamily N-acetyltransferase
MSRILDPELERKMDVIAEEIFGSEYSPDHIPITVESGEKLDTLTSHWIKYRLDEKGDPIAWAVVVPTTKELAQKFISKEITEKELFDLTTPQQKYSAVYLCAVVTIPEYRRKGLGWQLLKEAVEAVAKTEDYILFVWPVGKGGLELSQKVASNLGRQLLIRND